jgi:hypothetical protein
MSHPKKMQTSTWCQSPPKSTTKWQICEPLICQKLKRTRMMSMMRIKEPSEDHSVLSVAVVTGPISWFADVDNAMMDASRPVDLVGWQFQVRDGKWMLENNDLELKHSVLDYFMAGFPSNAW